MGKGHRRCEVCGIKEAWHTENKLLFSKFPLEPNRCQEWLKAVGNEELVHLPIENVHERRNVCANHFGKKVFNKKGNRLKRHAIPTLNLPAIPLTEEQLAEFPQHINLHSESKDLLPEAVLSMSQQSRHIPMELSQNDILPEAVPSTSQESRQILTELSQNEGRPTQSQKRSSGIIPGKTIFQNLSEAKPNLTPREKQLMEQLAKTKCSLASLRRSANLLEKLESGVLKEIVTSALKNQKRKLNLSYARTQVCAPIF